MEIGVRLLGAFELLLSWLVWPIYFFISLKPSPPLPPIRSNLLNCSAQQLAVKIRKRQVTSEEVVRVFIQRIREVNPLLNTIVEDRFVEAINEAQDVDKILESKISIDAIEKDFPFLGVPFTVKESCGLKGLSHSVGCKPRIGVKSNSDGDSVLKMRKAGAIALAVTNTPELCLCWETNNLVTGRTCNPYNVFRTSGGSSGGEAALIAAAGSVIGIGSDIAGSIRLPAMFCGIFGHKPTPGYVSTEGHYPNSTDPNFLKFLVVGPMARFAEDLAPMLKVMAGEKAKFLKLDQEVKLSELQIYYKEDIGFSLVALPVNEGIKECLRNAVQHLVTTYQCKAILADLEELADSVEISGSVFLGMEGIPDLLALSRKKERPKLYPELLKSIFGYSEFSLQALVFMFIYEHNSFIPRSKYQQYYEENDQLKEKINNMLGDNGVLLYPTYPIPAFHHNEFLVKTAGVMYTMIFNTLELPSTHVPLGLDYKGLPIGIQVIGAQNQDRLCLAVAKALESKFGGWIPPSNCCANLKKH